MIARKKWFGIIGLGAFCALGSLTFVSRAAASVILTPTGDTFVTTGASPTFPNSGNNYGGAGALSVAASGLAKGEFQTLMQFDSSPAKSAFDSLYGAGNWTVQSATLTLTASTPANPIFNGSAAGKFTVSWMQNNVWSEGTGTPALPTTDGASFNSLASLESGSDQSLGTFNFGGGTSGATTFTLALPSAFTSELTSGGLVSMRLFAADSSVSYLFNSRSFGTASARPRFTVDAVPEPASIGLAAMAAFGLLMRRRAQ